MTVHFQRHGQTNKKTGIDVYIESGKIIVFAFWKNCLQKDRSEQRRQETSYDDDDDGSVTPPTLI